MKVNMVVGARLARLAVHKLLLVYWDFTTLAQQSPGFTENGPKKREKKKSSLLCGGKMPRWCWVLLIGPH